MSTRILSDERKVTSHREIARINSHPELPHREQECQESLIQGKIHNLPNSMKASNIHKAKF